MKEDECISTLKSKCQWWKCTSITAAPLHQSEPWGRKCSDGTTKHRTKQYNNKTHTRNTLHNGSCYNYTWTVQKQPRLPRLHYLHCTMDCFMHCSAVLIISRPSSPTGRGYKIIMYYIMQSELRSHLPFFDHTSGLYACLFISYYVWWGIFPTCGDTFHNCHATPSNQLLFHEYAFEFR